MAATIMNNNATNNGAVQAAPQAKQYPTDVVTIAALGKFMTFIDATPINRIKIVLTQYDTKSPSNQAILSTECFLGIQVARGMLAEWRTIAQMAIQQGLRAAMMNEALSAAKLPLEPEYLPKQAPFESFGGGEDDATKQCVSRTLRVQYDPSANMHLKPWRWSVAMTRGLRGKNGAIQPDPNFRPAPNKQPNDFPKDCFVRVSNRDMLFIVENLSSWFNANEQKVWTNFESYQLEKKEKKNG